MYELNVAPASTVTFPNNFAFKGEEIHKLLVVPVLTFKLALKLEPFLGFILTLF